MNTMQISPRGLALTKSCEGCVLRSYQDSVGVWTIGYGHTHGIAFGMTCTQAQADAWLRVDMAWAETAVNLAVHAHLTQNQFDALCDFVFNEGATAFDNSTLLRMLNEESYIAAANQLPRWNQAAGHVLPGLVRRRELDRQLFLEQ